MVTVSILVQHHAGPTGDVLIVKKPGGAWQFPCGTQHVNETGEEAAERIVWETLGLKAAVGKCTLSGRKKPNDGWSEHIYYGNITHNTNSKENYHNYYEAVNKWQTEPKSDVYSEMKWVHPSELDKYEYDGDDVNFLKKYAAWINGREILDIRMY